MAKGKVGLRRVLSFPIFLLIFVFLVAPLMFVKAVALFLQWACGLIVALPAFIGDGLADWVEITDPVFQRFFGWLGEP